MVVTKKPNAKAEKLETISFRGKRKLWIRFVYTTKMRNAKNTWQILSRLIKSYIRNGN